MEAYFLFSFCCSFILTMVDFHDYCYQNNVNKITVVQIYMYIF